MRKLTRIEMVQFAAGIKYRLDLLAKTRVHTDRLLATRFTVFDYIKPNENDLSDIIRDLVDPSGAHGQGDVFLRKFLETMCGMRVPLGQFKSALREDSTSLITKFRRRMDVLVDLGTFGVAIENKPWAEDENDQIKDYVDHLDRRFAGRFIIIYLSPNGTKPPSIEASHRALLLEEGKLILSAYRGRFRDWLEQCYQLCSAEKVRWFLFDLMLYAEQKFSLPPMTANRSDHE